MGHHRSHSGLPLSLFSGCTICPGAAIEPRKFFGTLKLAFEYLIAEWLLIEYNQSGLQGLSFTKKSTKPEMIFNSFRKCLAATVANKNVFAKIYLSVQTEVLKLNLILVLTKLRL